MKGSDTQTNPTRSLHWADLSAAGVSLSAALLVPGSVAPRPCNVGKAGFPFPHSRSAQPSRLCLQRLRGSPLTPHPLSMVAQIPTGKSTEILLALRSRFGLQTMPLNQVESMNLKNAPMAPWIQQECPYWQCEIAFPVSANNLTFCEVIGARRKSR